MRAASNHADLRTRPLFGQTIQERFEAFHAANPHVYAALVRYAAEASFSGARSIGIAALWERLRWHVVVETRGGEPYRLNNDFRSRYARLIAEEHPELAHLFEVRKLRAA